MNIADHFNTILARHQHCPKGVLGQLAGEQMVRQHRPETEWAVSLLNIESTNQVLEIGFGAGRAIELMSAQISTGRVVGLELSKAMISSATRRNRRSVKAGKVVLQQGDVVALPFEAQQFDKVLSIHTFYFWSDVPRSIGEIFRVLKPGGMCVLVLSTGKIGSTEQTGLERYETILEEQVLPEMEKLGFTAAYVEQGPNSREFKIVAVVANK